MSKPKYSLSYYKSEKTASTFDKGLKTVKEYLYHYYRCQPDKDAIVFTFTDGSREAVTYKDLYVNAVHVAKCLVQLGLKKSEFVAISMRNSSKWLYAAFGAVFAGARPISLSFTYTDGSDVIAMMQKLQTCSLMFLDPGANEENWYVFRKLVDNFDSLGNVESKAMPYLRYLICHDRPTDTDNVLTLQRLLDWKTPEVTLPDIFPDDIFTLFQTSGSTGVPKAIAHTHASFTKAAIYLAENVMPRKDEIHFNDRPFTWIGGFPFTVVTGHTRVTRSGYCHPPDDTVGFLIDVISRERCTNFLGLPPLLNAIMERLDDIPEDWPVETVLTGGQPITQHFAHCIGKICKNFSCLYGSSEFHLGTKISVQNAEDFQEYSIGFPFPGAEMKVVDNNEEVVPVMEKGELYIKIDCLFSGYYNDPEKTRACITVDGWYRTDDIGYMTEDGIFFCVGRKSEMILSGGFNVAPTILEHVLETCQGVDRAICVPVPHDVLFQVVCACVILEHGSDVTEDRLRSFCEEIHNDKPRMFTVLPTYYMFLKDFPQTHTGKTSRRKLTTIATERFSKKNGRS